MAVEVTFDLLVELDFLWTGRLPAALMDEIRQRKQEAADGLYPHPLEPGILTSELEITIERRTFHVIFASDTQQSRASGVRSLRVVRIDESPASL